MPRGLLPVLPALLAILPLRGAATSVIVLGKGAHTVHPGNLHWTLVENGKVSSLPSGTGFKVPPDRYLVVSKAAFTIHGGAVKYSRGAHFVLSMKQGGAGVTLAQFSGRFLGSLKNSTLSERFTPGLVVAPGAELTGLADELVPGGEPSSLDVAFYGFLVPANDFKAGGPGN